MQPVTHIHLTARPLAGFFINFAGKVTIAAVFIMFCSAGKKLSPPAPHYQVQLSFHNVVGKDSLQLRTTSYQNVHGEPFTVTSFKYYISNISFTDDAGQETKLPGTCFLIDEKDTSSRRFTVSLPSNKYAKLNFYVGVDSLKNVSGVQTGALDPMNGMFWTWNTGYIMAKLEGNSPASIAPFNGITYHIGGFKGADNVVKKVSLILPAPLDLSKDKPGEIQIAADINAWFSGASDIKIRDHAFCMNAGTLASSMAANYLQMFSIQRVIN